jgi:hypothetical protein
MLLLVGSAGDGVGDDGVGDDDAGGNEVGDDDAGGNEVGDDEGGIVVIVFDPDVLPGVHPAIATMLKVRIMSK